MGERFDGHCPVSYTRFVRRTLAAVLALSLFALQGQALAFHVHATPAHDDEHEHRHGPAIHHHDDDHHDEGRSSSSPTLAGHSDSAGDVITITVPAATAFAVDVADAESRDVFSLHVPQVSARVLAIDVRSHGPPAARSFFLRGPPSSTLL
jgi:hypothetical protein